MRQPARRTFLWRTESAGCQASRGAMIPDQCRGGCRKESIVPISDARGPLIVGQMPDWLRLPHLQAGPTEVTATPRAASPRSGCAADP
jgi:hypothetical protein